MELHQLRNIVSDAVVKMQLPQALPRHFRANGIMVVEADFPAGLKPAGARLPDIMHKRGKPQLKVRCRDRAIIIRFQSNSTLKYFHRMVENIFMMMGRVRIHLQRRKLRKHIIGQPRFNKGFKPLAGMPA